MHPLLESDSSLGVLLFFLSSSIPLGLVVCNGVLWLRTAQIASNGNSFLLVFRLQRVIASVPQSGWGLSALNCVAVPKEDRVLLPSNYLSITFKIASLKG